MEADYSKKRFKTMRYVFLLVVCALIVGCSSKQPDVGLENDKMLNFGMANSKKLELFNPHSNAKTYVVITYLNPIKHALITGKYEQFIVGTYMATGEEALPKVALANFEINNFPKEEIKVSKLSFDSPFLTLVSSANPWTDYLLVEAPISDTIDMTISFENDRSSRVSASFQKDY
jgi:hypothetical protein